MRHMAHMQDEPFAIKRERGVVTKISKKSYIISIENQIKENNIIRDIIIEKERRECVLHPLTCRLFNAGLNKTTHTLYTYCEYWLNGSI